jgi:hypothetical protein
LLSSRPATSPSLLTAGLTSFQPPNSPSTIFVTLP